MKVAQLAAYVAEKSAYHHGEVSLADTIVKLANDYMGSNNVNLLEPCGQFGTRLMGGKDASQTRYIFTKLTKDARKIFDPRDDPILNYLDDDGRPIEPDFYMPTLTNGSYKWYRRYRYGFQLLCASIQSKGYQGQYSKNSRLKVYGFTQMRPWFKGFKGKIYTWRGGTWMMPRVCGSDTGINITRLPNLPPGRWTQDYKEYLDTVLLKRR
jgi:DNA topoisomerase-2